MAELLPCPFCGGEVDHYCAEYISLRERKHRFECKQCEGTFFFYVKGNYKEGIKIWNTRTQQKYALDLINRQKAELERLNIELQAMRGAANLYKAEVERYKGVIKLLEEDVKTAKSEAVKEFTERVKDLFSSEDEVRQDIGNLVQEKIGDEN